MERGTVAARRTAMRDREMMRSRRATTISARPGVKVALFGVVFAALIGLLLVAAVRDAAPVPAPVGARPVVATPRPALSAAEEAYAQALWPVHNEVKAGALKMTMSGVQYKTQRLDVETLRSQVAASLEIYRRAEVQIRALQPPPSLNAAHDEYLGAVVLYQQSAAEMMRIADDREEQHLLTAFPLSQDASRALRAVGAQLWPGEYVPS